MGEGGRASSLASPRGGGSEKIARLTRTKRNASAGDGTHHRTGSSAGKPIQGKRTERQAMPSTSRTANKEAESVNIAGEFAGNDTNILIINIGYRVIRTRTYPAGHRSRTRGRSQPRKPRSTRSQNKRFKRLSLAWIYNYTSKLR